tara:strand:+ start:4362 stop:5015 length:654 start_codon:yes stop_codon:yes gene_type:complete
VAEKVDGIIFDLDGTLWDATDSSSKAWSKTAENFSLKRSVAPEDLKSVIGLPFEECIQNLFGDSATPELIEELEKNEIYFIQKFGGILYPEVEETLKKLSTHFPLYLVSNCQTWYLEAFFNHHPLQKYFQDSLCFGMTLKPKSENLKMILKKHQMKCPFYVGDTHWDFEACQKANVKFIFAKYGLGKLKDPRSIISMDRFSDLTNIFDLTTRTFQKS